MLQQDDNGRLFSFENCCKQTEIITDILRKNGISPKTRQFMQFALNYDKQ